MINRALVLLATGALLLGGCSRHDDRTNVADASNSAGMALENSVQELDATTDNQVDAEIANINAASNDTLASNAEDANVAAGNRTAHKAR